LHLKGKFGKAVGAHKMYSILMYTFGAVVLSLGFENKCKCVCSTQMCADNVVPLLSMKKGLF